LKVRATAALLAALCACAVPAAHALIRIADNGILVVSVDDSAPAVGLFTIATGALHPQPRFSVFYPIGSSYLTLRDVTAQEVWANADETVNQAIAPFLPRSMQSAPAAASLTAIPGGFRAVYALPHWRVTQDVVLSGTTLLDTRVRHTIEVENTSAIARSYGLRALWDWEIAEQPQSRWRARSPDSAFTAAFAPFDAPAFRAFEVVDRAIGTTYAVFGTVAGGPLTPAPTLPDRVAYVQWLDFYEAPWDYPVGGADEDAATVHFWGYREPLTLAPGARATFHQYVTAHPAALGLQPDEGAAPVPAVSPWALAGLAGTLALCAYGGLARKGC
jgi:hypothetical protein